MRFKGTLFFAILVISLGIFSYFDYQKNLESNITESGEFKLIANVPLTEIHQLKIVNATGELELVIENNRWMLKKPLQDFADGEAVVNYLRDLGSYDVIQVNEEGESLDKSQYGLNVDTKTIEFKTQSGSVTSLKFGSKRGLDNGFYIQKNNDENIYLGSSAWEMSVNKSVQDFRSRRLEIQEDEITGVEISYGSKIKRGSLNFSKVDGAWLHENNKNIILFPPSIEDYILSIKNFEAMKVVDAAESIKKANALLTTKYDLKVVLNSSSDKTTLYFGEIDRKDVMYFKSSRYGNIYETSKPNAEALFKNLIDFRDKGFPFQFATSEVAKIEIDSLTSQSIFVKTDEKWKVDSGQSGEVNLESLSKLIGGIAKLRVEQFLTKSEIKGDRTGALSFYNLKGDLIFQIVYFKADKSIQGEEYYNLTTTKADEVLKVSKLSLDNLLNQSFVKASSDSVSDKPKGK